MAKEYESSKFLTELTNMVNEVSDNDGGVAWKQGLVPMRVSMHEFYTAVFDSAIKKNKDRLPKQWALGTGPTGVPKIDAYLGGAQVSAYLVRGGGDADGDGDFKLDYNPFEDWYFLQIFLYMYSNRKITEDGTVHTVSYDDPFWDEDDEFKNYPNYIDKFKPEFAFTTSINNKEKMYHRYGFFQDPKTTGTDTYSSRAYNEYLLDRIAPQLLSGYPPAGPPFESGFYWQGKVINLHTLLMEQIKEESPEFDNADLRRAFLLAGGEYYGSNDIPHLNIMDAVRSPTRSDFKYIPKDVREFWELNHEKAVRIETSTGKNLGKVLDQVAILIDDNVTLDTFAKYITHGAPENAAFADKVLPYDARWKQYAMPERSPVVMAMPDKTRRVAGAHKKTYTMQYTMVFPRLYRATFSRVLGKSVRFLHNTERDLRRQFTDPNSYAIQYSNQDGTTSYLGNFPGTYQDGDRANGGQPATGNRNNIQAGGGSAAQNSKAYKRIRKATQLIPPTAQEFQDTILKAQDVKDKKIKYRTGYQMKTQYGGSWPVLPLPGSKSENQPGVQVSMVDTWRSWLRDIKGVPNFPTQLVAKNEFDVTYKVGAPPDIPSNRTILDFEPLGKDIDKYAAALGNAVETRLGASVVEKLKTNVHTKKIVTDSGVKIPYNKTLMKGVYYGLLQAQEVITDEFQRLKRRAVKLEDNLKTQDIETATKDLLIHPLESGKATREAATLQLWLDSVNSTAAKVQSWMYISSVYAEAFVQYYVAKLLIDADDDTISDSDLNKPSHDQKKLPFDLTLPPPPGAATGQTPLTEDEIEARLGERKKNIDQCLISSHIETFAQAYRNKIWSEVNSPPLNMDFSIHTMKLSNGANIKIPFGGRFHLLADSEGNHSKIPNYLSALRGHDIDRFKNITTDIMAGLTPKIRLYRVSTDSAGRDNEMEFVFENFVSTQEVKGLKDGQKFEKGRGCGIKSLTWTYEGGTPATAKKDINAELTLYFQTFNELTKWRGTELKKYKYIDLLLYPNNRAGVKGNNSIHPNQYNPSDFRIRADIGWNPRTDDSFADMLFEKIF